MPSNNIAEGILEGTDGVVSPENDHPVCAFKGRFAIFS